MRSVPLIFRRCRRRRRLPLVHRLPPEHEHVESSASIFNHCWRERYSSDCRRFSLWTRFSAIYFHNRQSQLNITTSLKSLSQKKWLYHQILKWSFYWPVQLSQCKSINQAEHKLSHIATLETRVNILEQKILTTSVDTAKPSHDHGLSDEDLIKFVVQEELNNWLTDWLSFILHMSKRTYSTCTQYEDWRLERFDE